MLYMKGTSGLGLLYHGGGEALKLEVFSDASYQAGERGQTGWVATLGGAAVAWKSGRQSVLSDSSCAAEFRAAKAACREIIWLRFLLEFLQCPQPGVPLGIDNKSALSLLHDADGSQTRCKDLCRDFAMVHDWIHIAREVVPRHVAGKTQPADFLTKQLGATAFKRSRETIGMHFMMLSAPAHTAAVTTGSVDSSDDEVHESKQAYIKWALLDSGGKAMFTRLADWGECCAKQSACQYSLKPLFEGQFQCGG